MQGFTKQKDLGNQEFKNKNYEKALQIFLKTTEQIQKIETKQYLVPTTELGKIYVILLINTAFACINLKKPQLYQKAIQLSTKALSVDQKNLKALFRRGVAMKQYAQGLQRQSGSNCEGLLQLYTKAKQDFEQVNLLDKSNDLALEKFKQTVKDIYRVTKSQGGEINLSSKVQKQQQTTQKSLQQKLAKSNPYQGSVKKKGMDMSKIMEQYKVNQVSDLVQKKVQDNYLKGSLPQTRSQLQKAIRQIHKSQEIFAQFIYRFDQVYLNKINPTFDMLSQMIQVVLNTGKGEEGKSSLLILKSCKSFNLYWKSLVKRQKQEFKAKWLQFGLEQTILQ